MCQNSCRLQEIKQTLNSSIKLIHISFEGIKSDKKTINIEPILQSLSNQISIPSSECFAFFDFNNARERVINSSMSNEYVQLSIARINRFEEEFNKLRNVLMLMNNAKNRVDTNIIQGKYHSLKLIYINDLTQIFQENHRLEAAKRTIDMESFADGMTAFIESFRYKIRGELSRHNIEENEELTNLLEKCFNNVRNIDSYINKISICVKYVVDISSEMLTDTSFINELEKMTLEDEDKELIREYFTLSGE